MGEPLARLPKAEWTHEAHLATCAWLILERREIAPEQDLPDLIRRYNESVGGVNDETQGYHETITQVFIRGVRPACGAATAKAGWPIGSMRRCARRRDGAIGRWDFTAANACSRWRHGSAGRARPSDIPVVNGTPVA